MKQKHTHSYTTIVDAVQQRIYLNELTHAAWSFAHAALWSRYSFSAKEEKESKGFIRAFLSKGCQPDKAFGAFCERVLLAKAYVERDVKRYVPLPSAWLDPNNPNGFAGTASWNQRLQDMRSSMPLYRIEWRALGEAIVEMAEEPSADNFSYWKNYFLERKAAALIPLFCSATMNMQYATVDC